MHVHGNQFDPRIEAYALLSAARAEARQEAERVRRRLLESSSSLRSEADDDVDCVVRLSGGSSDGGQPNPQDGERSQEDQRQEDQSQEDQGQDQAHSAASLDEFSSWA